MQLDNSDTYYKVQPQRGNARNGNFSVSTLFDQSCCHYLSFCLRLWLAVLSTVRGSVHSGDGFSFIYCNAAALIKASWAVSHTDSVCQKPFQCLINWTLQRPRLHKVCRQWNLNLRIKQRLLLPNISININVQSEMYSPKQIHIISAYGKCYKVKLCFAITASLIQTSLTSVCFELTAKQTANMTYLYCV